MHPCIASGEIIVYIYRFAFEMIVRRNLQYQIARDCNQVFSTVRSNAGNAILLLIRSMIPAIWQLGYLSVTDDLRK